MISVNEHFGPTDCSLSCGDTIRSKTVAGVKITRDPSNGEHDQKSVIVGVFRFGIVVDVRPYIIAYSAWPDVVYEDGTVLSYSDLGDIEHTQYKVRDQATGITGWVGAGAVSV